MSMLSATSIPDERHQRGGELGVKGIIREQHTATRRGLVGLQRTERREHDDAGDDRPIVTKAIAADRHLVADFHRTFVSRPRPEGDLV